MMGRFPAGFTVARTTQTHTTTTGLSTLLINFMVLLLVDVPALLIFHLYARLFVTNVAGWILKE
jgi:cell shape-determining protein MreC